MRETRIIAVANQKGGVGKTSVTMGLASAALQRGVRTLVIDLDPRAAQTGVPCQVCRSVDARAISRPG